MELTAVREVAMRLREQVHRVVVGQDHAIDLLLVSLLCEGHILFEGVPGTAKLSDHSFMTGLKVEKFLGDGTEYESLREYVPGLDHRAIDWKSSARHRKLLCQEFRAERNHQLVLFVAVRDPSLEARALARPRSLGTLHQAVVAGDFARERHVVIERLRRAGAHCIDTAPATFSMALVNRYLDINRRELF